MIQQKIENRMDSQSSNHSDEDKLLLCCMRYQLNSVTASDVKDLIRNDLNWDMLIQNAVRQGVFMLLYQALKKTHSEVIPSSVFEGIELEAQKQLAYNLFLTNQLLQVLNLFAEHNIQAIPFKGPIWASLAYNNMVLRDFSDLDILVRSQDFSKAKDVLIRKGYYDKHFGELEESIGEASMVLPESRVSIDLHYKLAPQNFYLQIESESFFDSLQAVSLSGKSVSTFSPESCIAISYFHGTKEDWYSFKRICDFGALIQTYPEANWQEVIAQCGTNENDRKFWFAIAITQAYLQMSLPEKLSEKLKQFPEVVKAAKQWCDAAEMQPSYINRYTRQIMLSLWEPKQASLWSKLQYLKRIVFRINDRDQEVVSLPSFLFFLYYPLRVIRLIATYKINKGNIVLLWKFFKT